MSIRTSCGLHSLNLANRVSKYGSSRMDAWAIQIKLKALNATSAAQHVPLQRPECLVFVVTHLYVPADAVQVQRQEFPVRIADSGIFVQSEKL